jgi:hypothetical protein
LSKKEATPTYHRVCCGADSSSTRPEALSCHEKRVDFGSFDVTSSADPDDTSVGDGQGGSGYETSSTIIGRLVPGSIPSLASTARGASSTPPAVTSSGASARLLSAARSASNSLVFGAAAAWARTRSESSPDRGR